jgi:hypothetical protein
MFLASPLTGFGGFRPKPVIPERNDFRNESLVYDQKGRRRRQS